MKKYIFMAVAGMLALSSCSNDNDELNVQNEQNAPRLMTFTAGFGDGTQTRASLSGKVVSFEASDQISIISKKNANTAFTTTAGGASATFSGTATDDSKFYAVYPYTSGLTLSGTTITGVVIPKDQSNAASTMCGWDPKAPIAYATTTGSSLTFKNACALLKVTNDFSLQPKGNITITDYNTTKAALTGTFDLDTSSGALTKTASNHSVFVNNVPYGKTIYIAIAPCTIKLGATFYDGTNYYLKQKSSVTFEAGKIYDIGNVSDWPMV